MKQAFRHFGSKEPKRDIESGIKIAWSEDGIKIIRRWHQHYQKMASILSEDGIKKTSSRWQIKLSVSPVFPKIKCCQINFHAEEKAFPFNFHIKSNIINQFRFLTWWGRFLMMRITMVVFLRSVLASFPNHFVLKLPTETLTRNAF